MTKKQLKELIKETIEEVIQEQNNYSVDERIGKKELTKVVTVMAVIAKIMSLSFRTYDNYELRQKWQTAYQQIEKNDPKKAEQIRDKIKELTDKHYLFGYTRKKRKEIEKEMDNILNDLGINQDHDNM